MSWTEVLQLAGLIASVLLFIGGVIWWCVKQHIRHLRDRIVDLERDHDAARIDLITADKELEQSRARLADVLAQKLAEETKNRDLAAELQQKQKKNVQFLTAGKALLLERNTLREKVEDLTEICEDMKEELAQVAPLQEKVKDLNRRIEKVVELEGKIWEREIHPESVPAFRPLLLRKTPIIAVANLKGGVGKTTVTANLGASFWRSGKRVLLIDLDNQGSLTALCLPPKEVQDLKRGDRFVHRLFKENGQAGVLPACITRIGQTEGCIVAANEALAEAENHAMNQWLLEITGADARFLLRNLLHDSGVYKDFDLILLDCPPRLTTATINALTCCDFVLVPVLLDQTSTAAVPRILKWLRFHKTRNLWPDLDILGVVGNRAHPHGEELISREREAWRQLSIQCKDAWSEPVFMFKTVLRDKKAQYALAVQDHLLAVDLSDELQGAYSTLMEEVRRRINSHESCRAPVLR